MHLPLETTDNNNAFIIAIRPFPFSPVEFAQHHVRKFSTNYAHLSCQTGIKFSAKAALESLFASNINTDM